MTSSSVANQRYLAQRQWMGVVSHSAPIFLAPGNHENEEGWNFDDPNSIALLSLNARKRYYPNPIPDAFDSGNPDTLAAIDGDHLREDYFAWKWGDALFIFIDPYQYTMTKPYPGTAGGEVNDEGPASNDNWDWTLGQAQFNWFKQALEDSDAAFKFVFAITWLAVCRPTAMCVAALRQPTCMSGEDTIQTARLGDSRLSVPAWGTNRFTR